MTIRIAGIKDAVHIAEIHVKSWRAAYTNIMPQNILDSLSVPEKTAMWTKIIEENNKKLMVYDEALKGIVGWVVYGPSRNIHDEETVAEIEAFYIDPSHFRCGYGKNLYKKVITELKDAGYTKVYLWALSANLNATAFYKKMGMIQNTQEIKYFKIGGESLEEVMYYLEI
ncbi:GNAT family N-acetyltransferase [Acinetobacter boissieri]|uniref:L-amino acid N-acyltransferase YncA n=1 Tax=Acinetobacter boissieri TaxID=1219383 RepID=A0A1G6HI76_9GAMM|nr:GNAT family N-acetyltransferase [Acinetobacter boissieri]SDB93146.1 L-amino acid N-acyltransferase YncA [Acinetobacter boissieri]